MKRGGVARNLLVVAPLLLLSGLLVPLPPLLPPPPSASAQFQPPAVEDTFTGFPNVGPALFEDSSGLPDPIPLWGSIDCQERSRHELVGEGGDLHPTAQLSQQDNGAFRRLTVLDGDDYYGERCELGRNDHRDSPVALYREKRRRLTFLSFRLPNSYPLNSNAWQVVMQMKQSQPSVSGGGVPMLSLQARDGHWRLLRASQEIWSTPAHVGVWTRFAFDVTYSRKPKVGSIKVYADLNGDGDATDHREVSRSIAGRTLKREHEGGVPDRIPPGNSIPSHLRVGLYHDPSINCLPPSGCFVDVDNVGVYEPG